MSQDEPTIDDLLRDALPQERLPQENPWEWRGSDLRYLRREGYYVKAEADRLILISDFAAGTDQARLHGETIRWCRDRKPHIMAELAEEQTVRTYDWHCRNIVPRPKPEPTGRRDEV